MNNKNIGVLTAFEKCSVCGHEMELDTNNIKKREVFYYTGDKIRKNITVLYAVCEECGETIFLQADNEHTYKLLDSATESFLSDDKKVIAKYNIRKDELKRAREKLNRKINHKNLYNLDGKFFYNGLTLR